MEDWTGRDDGGSASAGADRPLWLVINLDRSPDRLAAMAGTLGALGIPFTRVPAVEGRAVPSPLPGVDPQLYRATHGRELLPGELGCTLSHLRALKTFLATPRRHAVILEDDALVTREAATLVAALVAPGAPDDWDLVKLEAHHGRYGLTTRRIAPGVRLCALPYRSAGSAAYLLDRAAAEALLAGVLPMRFPYDIALDRGWELGLRIRAVLPLPVRPAPVASTMTRTAAPGAKRRAPALLRARSKIMYAATALSAWIGVARPASRATRQRPSFDLVDRALAACGPGAAREAPPPVD